LDRKLTRQGNIGIVTGLALPLLAAGLGMIWPGVFTTPLLHKNASLHERDQANSIMRIVLLGSVLDGGRILSSAPQRAFNDILLPALAGWLCMTILGLPVGGATLLTYSIGLVGFFAIRNGTIIPPMLLNLYRWFQYQRLTPAEKLEMQKMHLKYGGNCSSILRPVARLKGLLQINQSTPLIEEVQEEIFGPILNKTSRKPELLKTDSDEKNREKGHKSPFSADFFKRKDSVNYYHKSNKPGRRCPCPCTIL